MSSTESVYHKKHDPTETNSIYDINKLNVDKDVGDATYPCVLFPSFRTSLVIQILKTNVDTIF